MHLPDDQLKSVLISSSIVDEPAFEDALKEASRLNQPLAEILIGRKMITEEYLFELLEARFNIPSIDLRQVEIRQDVVELLPEAYAKQKGVIIFKIDEDNTAHAAMRDPFDLETVEYIRAKISAWIAPYFTSRASLRYGLKYYKSEVVSDFNKVISENVKKMLAGGGETDVSKLAEAIPIVTIFDSLIEQAVAINASDVHFEPFRNMLLVRFRIDGVCSEITVLHKAIEPILVARVKILANLRIDEHFAPQDGRFKLDPVSGDTLDVRVNVMPVMHGERIALRLLKNATRPQTLEELGVTGEGVKTLMNAIRLPHGMILVTGPTGHGKTTTLYSVLHILNTEQVNIMTIEDPIEYEVDRINQTQVNTKAGITFSTGLRSHLRQNPDIIMVGEIRDNETVEIAVHAALTGHLVLSTLHTTDAPSALPRLLDMGAPAFLLVGTINAVIAQRLVRRICVSCVESYKTPKNIESIVANHADGRSKKVRIPETSYKGKGCSVCGFSGFQGQIGIFEILTVTPAIKDLLLNHAPVSEIQKQALKEGMVTMFEDGIGKVEQGITTLQEVIRVIGE